MAGRWQPPACTSPTPDFSGQARLLGETTARLHAELAATFGSSALSASALGDLADGMATELTEAVHVVDDLREHEEAVRACYAKLVEPGTEVTVRESTVATTWRRCSRPTGGPWGDDPPGPPGAGHEGDAPPRPPVLTTGGTTPPDPPAAGSCSTSRGNRLCRSPAAGRSRRRCATSPAC